VANSKEANDLAESSFKKKERQLKEGEKAYADYLAEQRRVQENTARLRALRLAREEAEASKPTQREAPRRGATARQHRRSIAQDAPGLGDSGSPE
jgi:hypothetical protein